MKKIFISIASILLIASCSKDNNEQPKKTTKELLVANYWNLTAYKRYPGTINQNGDTITDIYADLADCDKDGYIKFTDYDTIIYNNGSKKCLPNESIDSRTLGTL
jgi:hypothetical protein